MGDVIAFHPLRNRLVLEDILRAMEFEESVVPEIVSALWPKLEALGLDVAPDFQMTLPELPDVVHEQVVGAAEALLKTQHERVVLPLLTLVIDLQAKLLAAEKSVG